MPADRWALIALSCPSSEEGIRKAIAQGGLRATCASDLENCIEILQRRGFLCAFVDRKMLRRLKNHRSLLKSTYIVLVDDSSGSPTPINLQVQQRLHEWVGKNPTSLEIQAALHRARVFSKQANELDFIRSTTAKTIREDASLLCIGSWQKSADSFIRRLDKSEDPVLIAGEEGCGKTHFAQLFHYESTRAASPFIVVDCKVTDAKAFERDVFGEIPPRNQKQKTRPSSSKISLAANGTLLFDQVHLLHRRTQEKIARVLNLKSFSPLGGGDRIPVQCRFLFTTDIEAKNTSPFKRLQRDLARTLKKNWIKIPALRDRGKDFTIITKNVLQKLARENQIKEINITDGALELLRKQKWPGNLKQLEKFLAAATLQSPQHRIDRRLLSSILSNGNASAELAEHALEDMVHDRLASWFEQFGANNLKDIHPRVLERIERPLISLVLKETKGNQVKASIVLGINRNTLRRKMTQYQIR